MLYFLQGYKVQYTFRKQISMHDYVINEISVDPFYPGLYGTSLVYISHLGVCIMPGVDVVLQLIIERNTLLTNIQFTFYTKSYSI